MLFIDLFQKKRESCFLRGAKTKDETKVDRGRALPNETLFLLRFTVTF
jgi:hypothetical protein